MNKFYEWIYGLAVEDQLYLLAAWLLIVSVLIFIATMISTHRDNMRRLWLERTEMRCLAELCVVKKIDWD
jgi:hypothetical protein